MLQINFLVTLHSTTSLNKNLLFLHSVDQSCKVCTRLLHEISQGERHLFVHKVNLSQVGKGDNIQLKQEFTIINNSYKMTSLGNFCFPLKNKYKFKMNKVQGITGSQLPHVIWMGKCQLQFLNYLFRKNYKLDK